MSKIVDRFEELVKRNFQQTLRIKDLSISLFAAKKELIELKAKSKIRYKKRLALEDKVISLNNELMNLKTKLCEKASYASLEARYASDKEFYEHKILRLEGKLADLGEVVEHDLTTEDVLKAKEILNKIPKESFNDEHAINMLIFSIKKDEAYVTRLLNSWKHFNVK